MFRFVKITTLTFNCDLPTKCIQQELVEFSVIKRNKHLDRKTILGVNSSGIISITQLSILENKCIFSWDASFPVSVNSPEIY